MSNSECLNNQVHLLSIYEVVGKEAKPLAVGVSDFNYFSLAVCDGASSNTTGKIDEKWHTESKMVFASSQLERK